MQGARQHVASIEHQPVRVKGYRFLLPLPRANAAGYTWALGDACEGTLQIVRLRDHALHRGAV